MLFPKPVLNLSKRSRELYKGALSWLAAILLMAIFWENAASSSWYFSLICRDLSEQWNVEPMAAFPLLLMLNITLIDLGTALIASRLRPCTGVALLLAHLLLETLLYGQWMSKRSLLRNVGVAGCLLLLLAQRQEALEECDWPKLEKRSQQLLLAVGRCCLASVYIVWLDDKNELIFDLCTSLAMGCVLIGFRCRLIALLTIAVLFTRNLRENSFWWYDAPLWTLVAQRFCLTLSLMAGWLLLALLGPGKWALSLNG